MDSKNMTGMIIAKVMLQYDINEVHYALQSSSFCRVHVHFGAGGSEHVFTAL